MRLLIILSLVFLASCSHIQFNFVPDGVVEELEWDYEEKEKQINFLRRDFASGTINRTEYIPLMVSEPPVVCKKNQLYCADWH